MIKNTSIKKNKLIKNIYINFVVFMFIPLLSNFNNKNLLEKNFKLDRNNHFTREKSIEYLHNKTTHTVNLENFVFEPIIETQTLFKPDLEDYNINETVYSGMKLSHKYEDEIRKLCYEEGVPYEIILTIGEQESHGEWNNTGVISSTNDYGDFQINECNLKTIEEELGYTKEEVLNDPIKNAKSCIYLVKRIMDTGYAKSKRDIFGLYNGWIRWKKIKHSVNYADSCMEIMNKYFSKKDKEHCQLIYTYK